MKRNGFLRKIRQGHQPPAVVASFGWWAHHVGIPSNTLCPDEVYLPHLKRYVSGFKTSQYGIKWMRFESDRPVSELVHTVPHNAF